jgi:glycosidase
MGDAAKAFAVLCATWNGIPLIYGGQELPNFKALKFFEKDSVEWSNDVQLHEFYKKLLTLKSTNPALRAADIKASTQRIKTSADDKIFSFLRKNANDEVLVVINLSPGSFQFSIEIKGRFREIFSNRVNDFSIDKTLSVEPWQYFVFEKLN